MKTINLRNYENNQQTHVAYLIYKIRHCMEKFQRVVLMLLMKSYFFREIFAKSKYTLLRKKGSVFLSYYPNQNYLQDLE